LPAGRGWYDFWSGDYYRGGQEILLPAPWDRPPLLAGEGCAIPLNIAEQHFLKRADQRGFCLFPPRSDGQFNSCCFEDDGESEGYREGHFWTWQLQITASRSDVLVNIERQGEGYPKPGQVSLLLPRQENRRVEVRGGSTVADTSGAAHRELVVTLT
jgi:alpha-glucosidase